MKSSKPKYQQIIDAAVTVIAENGYHASQVSKIAKEAGVADGTIYLYFKNKEDVLVSLFEEKMGQFIEKIANATEEQKDTNSKLKTLIQMHFTQLEENPKLAIVTQLELRQSNYSLRLQINNVLKPYLNVIDSIIEEGKQNGQYRDDINTALVRQMIFGTLDEVVTNWVMKESKYELAGLTDHVHDFITQGLKIKSKN